MFMKKYSRDLNFLDLKFLFYKFDFTNINCNYLI